MVPDPADTLPVTARLWPPLAVRAESEAGLYESPFDLFTRPHPGLGKLLTFIGESLAAAGCGRKNWTWQSSLRP
jgi:hypothetical protein